MDTLVTQVLRSPDAVALRDDPRSLARLAPPLLALACGGAALLGLAVGSSSGVLQAVYAAIKLPVLFLAPPLVVLPMVHAAAEACGVATPWSRLGLAALAGLARSGLVAAAVAPLVWLPLSSGLDYHLSILLFVGAFGLVATPAMATVARAIPAGGVLRGLAVVGTVGMLSLVTAQTGWVLRPFVEHPTGDVTFVRPVESDVFSAIGATMFSAVGDYDEDSAAREHRALAGAAVSVLVGLLAAWGVCGAATAALLLRRGHPLATALTALVVWPALLSLLRDERSVTPGGPYASAIQAAFTSLRAAMRDPGLGAEADGDALDTIEASLWRADQRLAAVDRLLSDPLVAHHAEVERLRGARARAGAEVEAVLQQLVTVRVQLGLVALAGDTEGVRAHLSTLAARARALEEVTAAA